MKLTPINNNNQNTNTFGKLNKVACKFNSISEKRVKIELENMALNNDFFTINDVNANIMIQRNIAELTLKYKPAAKNLFDKIKNLFVEEKEIKLTKYRLCPDEGMFFLVKEMRKTKTSEDILNLTDKNYNLF